jgi:hypothetical protein
LRAYYRDGWGELEDDRQGSGLLSVLLHTLAHTHGDIVAKLIAAWREFAPWLPEAEFERMAAEVLSIRRKWSQAKLGQRIGLTYADRQRRP